MLLTIIFKVAGKLISVDLLKTTHLVPQPQLWEEAKAHKTCCECHDNKQKRGKVLDLSQYSTITLQQHFTSTSKAKLNKLHRYLNVKLLTRSTTVGTDVALS